MKDPAARIEVAMRDSTVKAREVRARTDLSAALSAALVIEKARHAARCVLFDQEIPFSSDNVRAALADAVARWACAASAVSPEQGAPVSPWPMEPEEHRTLQ